MREKSHQEKQMKAQQEAWEEQKSQVERMY
jgi:hypothetical protein